MPAEDTSQAAPPRLCPPPLPLPGQLVARLGSFPGQVGKAESLAQGEGDGATALKGRWDVQEGPWRQGRTQPLPPPCWQSWHPGLQGRGGGQPLAREAKRSERR